MMQLAKYLLGLWALSLVVGWIAATCSMGRFEGFVFGGGLGLIYALVVPHRSRK